jgi:hypothetical protein
MIFLDQSIFWGIVGAILHRGVGSKSKFSGRLTVPKISPGRTSCNSSTNSLEFWLGGKPILKGKGMSTAILISRRAGRRWA